MALERLHVVPHNNEWAVKEENKTNPESTYGTQREAIDAARELCKKNEADLVIHRPDGTIRNVYSYSEAHTANVYDDNNGDDKKAADRTARDRPELRDLASVGSRISWGAILAGAAVCLSMIIALGVLCAALGLTVRDNVSDRTLFVGAMICSIVTMVTALFLGGYITSLVTAGENKMEAGIYGIVLWGTVFAILTGLTAAGANVGSNALIAAKGSSVTSDALEQAGLDREEAVRIQERLRNAAPAVSATETAWWTFGGLVLSMAAAIGGSLLGSGPELVLRRRRVPADARTGRAGTRVVTTS